LNNGGWTEAENNYCLQNLNAWRQCSGNKTLQNQLVNKMKPNIASYHDIAQHMRYLDKITTGTTTNIQKDQGLVGIHKK
jgi:hypothetical protein